MDVAHALEANLDAKSKQYKDHSLAHLFIMNNIHYIITSICRYKYQIEKVTRNLLVGWNNHLLAYSSEVKDLFGEDWVQRRRRIVQQHAIQYIRVSWGKVKSLKAQSLRHPIG